MTPKKRSNPVLVEYANRLNEALDDLGVPPKHKGRQGNLAEMMGVTQKGAGRWLEGKGMPRTTVHQEHAKKLKVRVEWLFYGLGPKRKNDLKDYSSELMGEIVRNVDNACDELLRHPEQAAKHKSKLITSLFEMMKR